MTEDEMVGWHHQSEFEQAPGAGDRQRGLACCSPRGLKESDTSQKLNGTDCNTRIWNSRCGPRAETLSTQYRGAWVPSLLRELDPR